MYVLYLISTMKCSQFTPVYIIQRPLDWNVSSFPAIERAGRPYVNLLGAHLIPLAASALRDPEDVHQENFYSNGVFCVHKYHDALVQQEKTSPLSVATDEIDRSKYYLLLQQNSLGDIHAQMITRGGERKDFASRRGVAIQMGYYELPFS
jgi:hypothetical protein